MTGPGLRLIKDFEGYREKAYPDPIHGWSVPTIGYGTTRYHTGQKVRPGDILNKQKAEKELIWFVDTRIRPYLEKIPHWSEMHDYMKGALESFAYNLGPAFYGNPDFSTITRRLKNKEWDHVPEALLLYRNPFTPAEEGLRRRREAEGHAWNLGLRELAKQSVQPAPPVPQKPVSAVYPERIELDVPYYSQRDSRLPGQADRMCFSSSCSMLLAFLKPNTLGPDPNADDAYYTRLRQLGRARGENWDTTEAKAQIETLKYFKVDARFRQDLSIADIDKQLERKIPVVCGLLHHGPIERPSGGGHYMTVCGRTGKEDSDYFIVNDPWGEMNLITGTYLHGNGKSRLYSRKNFQRRFEVYPDGRFAPGNGWGVMVD